MSYKISQAVVTPYGYGTILELPAVPDGAHYKIKLLNDVLAFVRVR